MATTMTVQCPSCDTAFPVDPDKVPDGGVRTQCTVCETQFRVDAPEDSWADGDGAFWTPEAEAAEEAVAVDEAILGDETVDEAILGDGDETVDQAAPGDDDLTMDEPWTARSEPGVARDEVEVSDLGVEVEPADLDVEPVGSMEEEVVAEDSGPPEALDDWVVETEETGAFSAAGETEIELDGLDGVDEIVAEADLGTEEDEEAGGDDAYSAFMADEVVLSADELDVTVGEMEVETPSLEGDETPELPPLEPATEEPEPPAGMGAETVLEDLDEVETVFEPEDAAEVSADEPLSQDYVDAEDPVVEAEETAPPTGFQFGKRDPHDKARRLARVLVSDMITYNPERHARALENDSIKEDFEEEIEKSWAEYVEQVGQDLAESTSYWTEALNEILARGKPLF